MSGKPHILLAERQDSAISREQLVAVGYSEDQIDYATGSWLHPQYRGVFSVGTRLLTPRGRCWAAVLACGEGAVVSHRSAAALRGLVKHFPSVPEVTVDRAVRGPTGVCLHRRRLPDHELLIFDGLRVTSVDRIVLDLAATRPRREVEAATSEAEYLKLWDPFSLPAFLDAHKGQHGVTLLRTMLAEGAITITKSELERRFRRFLIRRRLPLPETNVPMRVNGKEIEADCVWPDARLIIELDGRAAHSTTSRCHDDRLRDRKLDLKKWTVWRVTARHLDDDLERDLRERLA